MGQFSTKFALGVVIFLGFGFFQSTAKANDVYISQNGGGNGSSCSSPLVYTYFNTSSNWTSGAPSGMQIGPGTTIHLCSGTYSFAGGTLCGLSFQGGGSSVSPVTLVADQGAVVISAPYWAGASNGGGICSSGYSYVTINGMGSLTIEATANGTLLANQQDYGYGVWALTGDNVTIENVTVSNIYVHACTEPIANCTDEGGQNTGGIGAQGSNVTISGNTIHDAKWCITGGVATGTTVADRSIFNNTIYNCDHGVAVGMGGTNSVLNGLSVHNNDISNFQNWDDAANNNHHDGIHIWSYNSGDSITGTLIYDNYIHGDWGAGMNSALFAEASTGIPSAYYFNNLVLDQSTVSHQGAGMIALEMNGVTVANNTMFASNVSISSTAMNFYGTGVIVDNNIAVGMVGAIQFQSGATWTTIDHNDYYNIGTNGWNLNGSFPSWQSSCSCDSHSTTSNPVFTSTYGLGAGSAAIALGLNLAGDSVSALDYDKAGALRPATGAWDAGAYDYGGSGTPQAPSNLAAAAQ
jgi:hypothetical protein